MFNREYLSEKSDQDKFVAAAINSQFDVIFQYLEKYKDDANAVNVQDGYGRTALYMASTQGCKSVVDILLRVKDIDVNQTASGYGKAPLHTAAYKGYLDVVNALIKAGADVNQATDNDATPLHIAARNGHLDVVSALLGAAADVNQATTEYGRTPLYIAACNGRLEVVNAFLEANANVNQATTDDGSSPLCIAAFKGHIEVARALLAADADVNQATIDYGTTPLYIAAENGDLEMVRLLLNQPDIDVNIKAQKTEEDLFDCVNVYSSPTIQRNLANFISQQNDTENVEISAEKIAIIMGHDAIVRLIRSKRTLSFEERLEDIEYTNSIPNKHCCPILHSIMNDPVTVSSGVTYDRANLVTQFALEKNPDSLLCSLTRKPIRIEELTNETAALVKCSIERFVSKKETAYQNTQVAKAAVLANTQHSSQPDLVGFREAGLGLFESAASSSSTQSLEDANTRKRKFGG